MKIRRVSDEQKEKILNSNFLNAAYINNFKLDENKKYLVTNVIKNENNTGDPVEPTKEILEGKIISQHPKVIIFECIGRNKTKKRVCINKIDYFLKGSLIKECK